MKSAVVIAVVLVAIPAFAQRRVDIFFDVEGVKRTGRLSTFSPGTTRFEPSFQNGGGAGGGFNLFVSDRLSFEAKVAALGTKSRIRVIGSDFIITADLGWAQIYPISATMQWHLLEHGTVRPYIGVGVVHTILKNINKRIGPTATSGATSTPMTCRTTHFTTAATHRSAARTARCRAAAARDAGLDATRSTAGCTRASLHPASRRGRGRR